MIRLTHGVTKTLTIYRAKSAVFATVWPGFYKFSQVIMLYEI